MKKLREGDCSFGTLKLILGWLIDTINMTIQLPQHRVDRLAEILNSIPATQRRTSVKKWYSILGELRSMALALPGSRNIFSTMQHALTNKAKGRIALNKEVHNALDDFRWMHNNIATRPTRIAEIIPLLPAAEGHHDASGIGDWGRRGMVPWRQHHSSRRLRQRKTHPMAIQVASIHRRQAHNRPQPKWHHLKF